MAEVKDVVVPDIGDFADVPVIEVMVSPGDTVAEEDPLVTLESDKATMDVPSPFGGVVQELKVKTGDTVSEGSLLLTLQVESNGASAGRRGRGRRRAGGHDAGAGGRARPTASTARSTPRPRPRSADEPTPPVREPTSAGGGNGAVAGRGRGERTTEQPAAGGPVYAGPGARRLARELGVDLAAVKGTGRKGRIQKSDVEAAAKGAPAAQPARDAAPAAASGDGAGLGLIPWPKVDFEKYGEIERVPLSRIKKISGANLHRNWVMIPHVTHYDEADITDLEAFRKQTNEAHAKEGVKVTMVALMIKAVTASLQAMPNFNASLDGDDLVLKRYINIGFAADTPNGLVVPVIKNADQKGILDIARELTELSGAARAGQAQVGRHAGRHVLDLEPRRHRRHRVQPDHQRPRGRDPRRREVGDRSRCGTAAEFRPRLMVPLSLSYDHRVIDGAEGARFCAHLAQVLGDLRRALL